MWHGWRPRRIEPQADCGDGGQISIISTGKSSSGSSTWTRWCTLNSNASPARRSDGENGKARFPAIAFRPGYVECSAAERDSARMAAEVSGSSATTSMTKPSSCERISLAV